MGRDEPSRLPLDRLSRSLKDLLEKIENTEAEFRSITENIDTSTPAGRMMQMVGSFAEFERAMLRERTKSGTPCLGGWTPPQTWRYTASECSSQYSPTFPSLKPSL
ncbi:recombinase family protein [Erwinia sp.]|uniref:recombinase family protein n=1 Tax=Erwinia citreus TaxID=558 RepID=UPI00289B7DD0|nr:recombinase family protein [Erwinia sp.]